MNVNKHSFRLKRAKMLTLGVFSILVGLNSAYAQVSSQVDMPDPLGSIDARLKNKNDINAANKQHLINLGKEENLNFLTTLVDGSDSFSSRSIIGRGLIRKKVHATLSDSFVVFLSSIGVTREKVSDLRVKKYNAIFQAEKVFALEGSVEDSIALSESHFFATISEREIDPVTGDVLIQLDLGKNFKGEKSITVPVTSPIYGLALGTECLFFMSETFAQYSLKKWNRYNEIVFQPYCKADSEYVSINRYVNQQGYSKSALDNYISKYEQ